VVAEVDVRLPRARESSPTPARLSIACSSVPSPSRRVAKHSLPPLRRNITRPVTPTSWPVAVSTAGPGTAHESRAACACGQLDRIRIDPSGQQLGPLVPPDAQLLREIVVAGRLGRVFRVHA